MLLPAHETKRLSKENMTQQDIEYFRNKYGKRFVRALRSVEEGRVTRYNFRPSETVRWSVRGSRREYLVIPEIFCTCRSFYHEVVIDGNSTMCYHLLAQKIAELRREYEIADCTDADRRKLVVKWRRTD
ncbi:MAG: hypothetical protein EAX95_01395 [Candidatus Thorarchaeota archaeon]|nr:hypothetical protein [Candidatus Thorarchaeota archaeon]